jgi:gliding motility-associated-like protein
VIDILDPGIYFQNTSDNMHYSYWTFGDGNTSGETNPWHNFVDTGYYNVTLYIITEYGCRDTVVKQVRVKEGYTFYAPNAFSPDHNGINEVFLVKGIGIDNSTFKMVIFSRWGDEVFESDDIEKGWDGLDKHGKVMDAAVYTWMVTYRDVFRHKHKYLGTVLLLR